jgi:excisionase family DNA binding protein
VKEIASHLGVKRETVYKLIARKKLPARKVGRQWRLRQGEVDAWVNSGKAAIPGRGSEVHGD